MGTLGIGYGSEWHLLYYFARHRHALNEKVLAAMKPEVDGGSIEWLDMPPRYAPDPGGLDGEYQGIDFLFSQQARDVSDYSRLRDPWRGFWPQSGTSQSWDAVGLLRRNDQVEWLLVEAKAHTEELKSGGCGAKGTRLNLIRDRCAEVGRDIGVADTGQWTEDYYQHANRIAALWFLLKNDVPARLLYLYFLGDAPDGRQHRQDRQGRMWPVTAEGWKQCLLGQDRTLCLHQVTSDSVVSGRVHKVFLPVIRGIANANVRTPLPQARPPQVDDSQ